MEHLVIAVGVAEPVKTKDGPAVTWPVNWMVIFGRVSGRASHEAIFS